MSSRTNRVVQVSVMSARQAVRTLAFARALSVHCRQGIKHKGDYDVGNQESSILIRRPLSGTCSQDFHSVLRSGLKSLI